MRLTTTRHQDDHRPLAAHPPLPVWSACLVLIAALSLIFVLDRATGAAPVQHLYYLPIVFAGFRFGAPGGAAVAAIATLLYHLANPRLISLHAEESDIVQIALFFAVGLITARLAYDARRLHQLAMTDDLTGLHNLRSFEAELAAMVRAARETKTTVALLVLDVDRLKVLNDAYGHLTGAEAVRTVGHLVGALVPANAVPCRYGGDEFVVALPRCSESRARAVADDIRRAVHEAAPVLAGAPFPAGTLSVSVGLACRSFNLDAVPGEDSSGRALFRAADAALYLAKNGGRNHVRVV